jgi:hypothetical protein
MGGVERNEVETTRKQRELQQQQTVTSERAGAIAHAIHPITIPPHQFLHHLRRSPVRHILSWITEIARDLGIWAIAGLFI